MYIVDIADTVTILRIFANIVDTANIVDVTDIVNIATIQIIVNVVMWWILQML